MGEVQSARRLIVTVGEVQSACGLDDVTSGSGDDVTSGSVPNDVPSGIDVTSGSDVISCSGDVTSGSGYIISGSGDVTSGTLHLIGI